ncbi:histidine phosphatase family protein [Candidatus Nanohalobium constans]|uniref:2,3-bisphosphoglycerate-dependent phosphoglycerate mutase n=1 Tax=Candidatus Nanohalobium constans TaxID=2565781 RepID=A0A5Q0UFC5_9ARCH|nr:histidine phosphatase family protein [Candidatus Nanohalobium constans]QGA80313.1 2,3-bisphosphoglycerate-dependent phosphoglycerate mutase [Candidatus Nanohalobium constans]
MKFLRHFQTELEPGTPVSEWRLSEKGRKEMQKFVRENNFDIDIVYTSTERKAVKTARRIAEKADAELVKTELLCEVDRSGEGFVEDHDRYVNLVEDYLNGGKKADWEDQEEMRERFHEFIEMAEGNSLAVTHGIFLSLNVPEYEKVDFWHELGFGQIVHYDF